MSIRNSSTRRFSPLGLSDAIDGTHVPSGACSSLSNLIPSPTTKNLWVPRPAGLEITDFASFSDPGFISALKVVGSRAYGMISTSRFSGKDEPFIYDIAAGAFVTVASVTNAKCPLSPSPTGEWTPPTMALVGVNMVVTHPGYDGVTNYFGWFDLTDPNNPIWNAGNTTVSGTGVDLPFVPTCVAEFNGRAYFGVREFVHYTDPLTLNISSAASVLSFGNNVHVTALKPLALQTQLGGIDGALIVVKGLSSTYQIKGDAATNDLTIDGMNYAIGTLANNSLVDTPYGVAGIFPDGLRFIDFSAKFTDPIGIAGDGVNVPFISALEVTRIAAACNGSVLRVAVQNGAKGNQPFEEYWLHMARKVWSGPHTLVASLVQPYLTDFIVAPIDAPGTLYRSATVPSLTATYEEMGEQLTWEMTPVFLPDDNRMGIMNVNEMTINLAIDPSMGNWTAYISDANQALFDQVGNPVSGDTAVWDVAIWDADLWDGVSSGLIPRLIKWTKPITFSRAQLRFTGGSGGGVIIGDVKYDAEEIRYVPEIGI